MTEIVQAKKNSDYKKIADLATVIWTEHYTPIIGSEQVTYMLQKFQSAQAIQDQIRQGVSYFLTIDAAVVAGYFSFKKENETLFLSKFYVLKELRGLGIGKKALSYIQQEAVLRGCTNISLTVNKNNIHAIKAYEKMGFRKIDSVVTAIGNGFVMDDYIMEYSLIE